MTLSEVEADLQTVWTKKVSRENFLDGKLELFKNSQQPDHKAISLYAELLSIGQINLMESIYPACQRIISNADFESLAFQYMEDCPATHFNLNQSAKLFSKYLNENCASLLKEFPFLAELADYEWLELEVMELDVEWPASEHIVLDNPSLFANCRPVLNPTLQLRNYSFPISDIVDKLIDLDSKADERKIVKSIKKKPVTLAIFRVPNTHEVKFLELGEISRFAIEQIQSNSPNTKNYQELLASTIKAFSKRNANEVVLELLDILPKLEEHKLILGSTR